MAKGRSFSTRAIVAAVAAALSTAGCLFAEDPPADRRFMEVLPSKKAARLIVRNQSPDYPPIAKMNYIQGKVSLQAVVDASGEVKEAHVVRGHPFLAVAALKAIRNWLFKPARSRQGPAQFLTYVDVRFTLHAKRIGAFPNQPEEDLNRQVKPPELAEQVHEGDQDRCVRLRVLVGTDGHVLDSTAHGFSLSDVREARRIVASWMFRPARWGAIAVPWYMEVEVPLNTQPTALSSPAKEPRLFDKP